MAKKKKKSEMKKSSWLDTYADTITLLLTFFVLLYSMSTIDAEKVRQISQAFNEIMNGKSADSILEYDLYDGQVPIIGGDSDTDDSDIDVNQQATYQDIKEFVDKNDLSSYLDIIQDERGVILQLRDNILFETGEATLKSDALVILDKISALISTLPNNVNVEGHTDNVPINTNEFPSNWELSSARAVNVVRYFVDKKGQDAKRFTAESHADTEPITDNDTAEHRAENRRVNILIVANNEE